MYSLVNLLCVYVILVRCVERFVSGQEADSLLGWVMHIRCMLMWLRMNAFSPPEPKCQIVNCEAAYDDGNADDLHKSIRDLMIEKGGEAKRTNIL